MAITTWLTHQETISFTHVADDEVNELFQEVRAKIGNRFFLDERHIMQKPWFKPWYTVPYYTLYLRLDPNGYEVQVMNFTPEGGKSSICTGVSAATIMNYFFGVLAGIKESQK